jgi:hypothetical protein
MTLTPRKNEKSLNQPLVRARTNSKQTKMGCNERREVEEVEKKFNCG